MSAPAKLASFGAALALTFGAAYAIGQRTEAMGSDHEGGHGSAAVGHDKGGHGSAGTATASAVPPGLAVTADGYTLVPERTNLPLGATTPFRFTVTRADGKALTRYTPSHTKDLHLVVVRRDLAGFQHVHPTRAVDGTWSTPLRLDAAGTYRVFADFVPPGATTPVVLGTDISVAGDYRPEPLPEATTTARAGEYGVAVSGTATASAESELTFTVTRDGVQVRHLQPYLGAFGHLVALRAGDLAYLHTHPGQQASGTMRGGPAVKFMTAFPSRGSYRLFLDFQASGKVHTAAFTVTVS